MRNMHLLLVLCLCTSICTAQNVIELADYTVDHDGTTLAFPFVGGLNQPQFSNVDLNNDGIQDLLVFDSDKDVWMTFLVTASGNDVTYDYVPEYESYFPMMEDWVLSRDFNCDGIADLFTYSVDTFDGISVYEGSYLNDTLHFSLYDSLLVYDGEELIYNEDFNIPGIDDVDMDGDLDIVGPNYDGGFNIWYKNNAQEEGMGCDLFQFEAADSCWGNTFYKQNTGDFIPDTCAADGMAPPELLNKSLHERLAYLLIDMDGDDDKDLLFSNASSDNVKYLNNGGDNDDSILEIVETNFPSYDDSINQAYPRSYYVDVNNDDQRDLLVGNGALPNDLYNVSWYYHNTGTDDEPVFEYQNNHFLVDQMIDMGTDSKPILVDYNQDGLLDLIICSRKNDPAQMGSFFSNAFLYENVGSAEQAAFSLVTNDFANLSDYNFQEMHLTVGDIDGDEDLDLLIGDKYGDVYYFNNDDGEYSFVELAIEGAQNACPQLVDVNQDGLLDMVVGFKSGKISYYENIGSTTEYEFNLVNDYWGTVDVTEPPSQGNGYCIPFLYHKGESAVLLAGGYGGYIYAFDQLGDYVSDSTFNVLGSNWAGIPDQGAYTSINGGDLNNDGQMDFVVGNTRGGIRIYNSICEMPFNLSANVISGSSVAINWAGGMDEHQVYYKTTDEIDWTIISANNTNSIILETIACQEYELKIEGGCNGTFSNTIIFSSGIYDASWLHSDIIYECEEFIDLNDFILGDIGGYWSGEGVSEDGFLNPSSLSIGEFDITYNIGSDSCMDTQTQSISIIAFQSPDWENFSILSCDYPVDLNSYTNDPGGTWSGGDYIDSLANFNPEDLAAGFYEVTYTLGDGACEEDNTQTIEVIECSTLLKIKCFLEGPFNLSENAMDLALNNAGLIPLEQVFNEEDKWNYQGEESLINIPENMVDWILVEIRSNEDLNEIIERQAGLLLADGHIIGIDTDNGILLKNVASNESYSIVLYTRNHLAVISGQTIEIPNENIYDFTTSYSQALGENQQVEINGVYVFKAGDFNANGVISVTDYNKFINESNISDQYHSNDLNFDGSVNQLDYELYRNNKSAMALPILRD